MNITRLILLVCLTIATPSHAETIALWLFDDPPGSSVAIDSSGNGYHLTIGPDAAIVADGHFGGALNADATPEDGLGAFRYRAERALNPSDHDWTIECWLKGRPDMAGDNRVWGLSGVNYIDCGRGDETGLFVASRYLPLDGVLAWNRPTGDLKASDQFHHFAVVYDSAAKQLRHFFDGRLQFKADGTWKDVPTGEGPSADVIMPPHYPMLQIGCRDAYQQWDHREIHLHERLMKKFQGYIDEMRFSDEALYGADFDPPASFAKSAFRVQPRTISASVNAGDDRLFPHQVAHLSLTPHAAGEQLRMTTDRDWIEVKESQQMRQKSPAGCSHVALLRTQKLSAGQHTGTITVESSENHTATIDVRLTVLAANQVRDIGDRKQLFIDDRFIESNQNVELHINPPQKVATDFPDSHYPRNIVYLEDQKLWRMYFSPWSRLEHAESEDGLNWKRFGPNKIGYESPDDPDKLTPLAFHTMVMLDPHDVPERRFKAFEEIALHSIDADGNVLGDPVDEENKRAQAGVYAFYSADGLRFKKAGRVLPVLPEFVSFAPQWDHNTNKYIAFFRCQNTAVPGLTSIQGNQFFYHNGFSYEQPEGLVTAVAPETMGKPGFENLRSIARIETDDLLAPWPVSPTAEQDSTYATSNQVPMVFTADEWDGFADFYVHSTMVYPYAEDVYLMFPTYFRHFHPSRQPYFYRFDDANGPLETTLAVSRDGIDWDRVDRKAYVPIGRNDEWDGCRTMMGLGMTRNGNDLYQYYWGDRNLHDSVRWREELPETERTGLGVVKQRLDGFVSADVDYKGGHLTTPLLRFTGNRLQINHSCGGNGTIFVELRDANDLPLDGFALADCEEIGGDDVAWEVRWRGSGDISALAGKPVKLHFKMRNAKLFAFQFVGT